PSNITKIATDSTGAIYLLTSYLPLSAQTPPSIVTKLSPDGRTIVWKNQLDVPVSDMAVDPLGGVYVSPVVIQSGFTIFSVTIAKLNPTGSGTLWQRAVNISGVISGVAAPVLG